MAAHQWEMGITSVATLSLSNTKEEIFNSWENIVKDNEKLRKNIMKLENEIIIYRKIISSLDEDAQNQIKAKRFELLEELTEDKTETILPDGRGTKQNYFEDLHSNYKLEENHDIQRNQMFVPSTHVQDDEVLLDSIQETQEQSNYDDQSTSDYSVDTLIDDVEDVQKPDESIPGLVQLDVNVEPKVAQVLQKPARNMNLNKRFSCVNCSKAFAYRYQLRKHMNTHKDKQVEMFSCSLCSIRFSSSTKLKIHSRIHAKPTKLPLSTAEDTDLIYTCTECENQFVSNEELNRHSQKCHADLEKKFQCGLCPQIFRIRSILRNHMVTHTGERRHCCAQCGKRFKWAGDLIQHRRTHTGEKPYVCKICSRAFAYLKSLKGHMETHDKKKPCLCNICGKRFSCRRAVMRHVKGHTVDMSTRRTPCHICGKNVVAMINHMATHKEERYNCEMCGEKFRWHGQYRRHMMKHDPDQQKTDCDLCGRTYVSAAYLKKHLRNHAMRNYPCNECEKKFISAKDLLRHQGIVHAGQKAQQCHLCHQEFLHPVDLRNHIMRHTGEKLHVCLICDKKYTHASHLKRHVLHKHSETLPQS